MYTVPYTTYTTTFNLTTFLNINKTQQPPFCKIFIIYNNTFSGSLMDPTQPKTRFLLTCNDPREHGQGPYTMTKVSPSMDEEITKVPSIHSRRSYNYLVAVSNLRNDKTASLWICNQCNSMPFGNAYNIKRHINLNHNVDSEQAQASNQLKPNENNTTNPSEDKIQGPRKCSDNITTCICYFCRSTFQKNQKFKLQRKPPQQVIREEQCPYCDNEYSHAASLEAHKKKEHICATCTKTLQLLNQLK